MKLPEITQEIIDKFGRGLTIQLIEWVEKDGHIGDNPSALQWTQTAVDFARLIARGEEVRKTDEVTLQGLLEYSTSEQVYDLGDVISFALQQNEEIKRMRSVINIIIEERAHAKRSIGEYRDLSMSEKLKAVVDRYTG